MPKQNQLKYTAVSFFCGCGGLDLGFMGGFRYKNITFPKNPINILAAYDKDEKCIETYVKNISDNAYVKNLEKYKPESIPSCDVLLGGFPCQDFSTCGPRNGLDTARGRLYYSLVQYVNVHKPKIVIAENVPGLENIRDGAVLKTIINDFEMSNPRYVVNVWRLFAPDYGVPQRRYRLFIIGVRKDLNGFPKFPHSTRTKKNYRSISWAIKDLEKIEDESIPNQSQYFRASKAKKGNGQGDEVSKTNLPAYTIRANAKSRVQYHYSLNRRLTVRECARLQTFPDTFIFPHSATTNIMQIGNAVPPILGHKVAKSICHYLEEIQ